MLAKYGEAVSVTRQIKPALEPLNSLNLKKDVFLGWPCARRPVLHMNMLL